jgi:dienelactone hydrolase
MELDYSAYATRAPLGPHKVRVESDPGLSGYVVYTPDAASTTQKLPIVVWGNGGCLKAGLLYAAYNLEIASHGFLVIADGDADWGGGGDVSGNSSMAADGTAMVTAIDWALKENDRPCSRYYHRLETTKIAANGTSCGGLMSLGAAADPRVTTIIAWNSGLFERDQKVYDAFHTPVLYVNGGSTDISTPNGEADFNAYSGSQPFFWGVEERQEWKDAGGITGHIFSFFDDNGGEAAQVGLAWFRWHLLNDDGAAARRMFSGKDCGLCKDSHWTIKKKNLD